jgi:hypothetical protein
VNEAKLKKIFERHMNAFQEEVFAATQTPAEQEKIRTMFHTMLSKDQSRAKGFAVALAEHWEAFMPKVLALTSDENKRARLIEACSKMVEQQFKEIIRILGS